MAAITSASYIQFYTYLYILLIISICNQSKCCPIFCLLLLATRLPLTSRPPTETPGTAAHCTTSTPTSPTSTWRLWSPWGRSARTTTGRWSLTKKPCRHQVLLVCHFSGLETLDATRANRPVMEMIGRWRAETILPVITFLARQLYKEQSGCGCWPPGQICCVGVFSHQPWIRMTAFKNLLVVFIFLIVCMCVIEAANWQVSGVVGGVFQKRSEPEKSLVLTF